VNLSGEPAVELKAIGSIRNIEFRFRERLATIADFQFGQLFSPGPDRISDLEKHFPSIERRRFSPRTGIKRRSRCLDSFDDIFPIRFLDFRNELAIGWIA